MSLAVLGKGRFYGWISLAGAALVFFFMYGVLTYSFGVFLPFVCKEFGWSRGAVSGAYSMLMVVMGLSSPFTGMFIAKYGPRRSIMIGTLLGVLGLLLLYFHSHLWQLYVGYGALIGVGAGFGGYIATTTIANNWFERRRSLALSILSTAGGIGGLVLIPIIMKLIRNVGWRSTYLILSAIVLIFAVIIPGLLIRNKPEDLGQIPDGVAASKPAESGSAGPRRKLYRTPVDFTLGEALRTRAIWLFTGFVVAYFFAMSILIAHQVAFLLDAGIAAGMAATAMGLLAGVGSVGRLGMGFLGLKYDIQPLAIGTAVVMLIGMILVLLTKSLAMVFVYNVVLGIGAGSSLVAQMTMLPTYFGRTNYSKIIGVFALFGLLGNMGAPIAGALRDATGSYRLPFIIAVLVLIASLVCIILAKPPIHPSLKAGQPLKS